MTREEKELKLKDICGRLPYNNTMISVNDGKYRKNVKLHPHYIFDWDAERWDAKPYLRLMSSMTEEERLELSRLTDDKFKFYLYTAKPEIVCYEKYNYLEGLKVLDWLNEHHFDYRGLIPMGLAIEVTEDNNPYK